MRHTVYLDEMGGAVTMTCESLHLRNAVYPYEDVTPEGIERAIRRHTVIADEDAEIEVRDNRDV